ncbi:MAG: hypothetical protein EOP54_26090 [Sphingobacteriales bacterium]|nr:MAG: hypothetical protein EOP54_26090 [Sphingobacteriales bacterium]
MRTLNYNRLMLRTRVCIWVMIIGLFISGVTAFPLETELQWLVNNSAGMPAAMHQWLITVHQAIKASNLSYPFLSYGTDWLAFAHVMLAVLFVGPLRHPVRNIWVIEFGMIACLAIFALAFIAGPIRNIPLFWTLVDCSFGLIGIVPLYIAHRSINQMQQLNGQGL